MSKKLTVMTYNVQSGMNNNSPLKQARFWKSFLPHSSTETIQPVARFIGDEHIDVATFTEIDGGSFRTRGYNQIEHISPNEEQIPSELFQPLFKAYGFGNQGNAIISRHDFLDFRRFHLPDGIEQRGLEWISMMIYQQTINVFVTHLSVGQKARRRQIGAISEILEDYREPTILTGDFNTGSYHSEDLGRFLKRNGMRTTKGIPTFPSWNPTRSLDHIFYSGGFEHQKTYTPKLLASDHLPLVAEFQLR